MTLDPTIIAAIIGAMATIAAGYLRFVHQPKEKEKTIISYRGRVSDIENDQPVHEAKVEVQISGPTLIVYTDSHGIFDSQVMVNGEKNGRIKVKANGYRDYDLFIKVSPSDSRLERIRLTPKD